MLTQVKGLSIGGECDIHPDVVFEIDPGAEIVIGHRVSIRRGTTLQANRGSRIFVGDDVAIGEHVFISAMVGIVVGSGAGISNQVDIRDHNHIARERSLGEVHLRPWASGFQAAPIVIEKGALLSNKVTVTAGACIGRNVIVGANAVVTRHVRPDTVVAGAPARVIREFNGIDVGATFRPPFSIGWIGTSIMEHRQATCAALNVPWPVPEPGDHVEVTALETGGFVRSVTDSYQIQFPHLRFTTHNHALGGATSRDLVGICKELSASDAAFDLTFFGCGLNDIWRKFQGKGDVAVALPEFVENVSSCLTELRKVSRRVFYLEETPYGRNLEELPTVEMNSELEKYMTAVRGIAMSHGCEFIPVIETFQRTASALGVEADLWTDGIHLSRIGDHLLAKLVVDYSSSRMVVSNLSRLAEIDREIAPGRYTALVEEANRLAIPNQAGPR